MHSTALILILFTAIVAVLGLLTALRPELTRARGGKVLAFLSLFILPALAMWAETAQQRLFAIELLGGGYAAARSPSAEGG